MLKLAAAALSLVVVVGTAGSAIAQETSSVRKPSRAQASDQTVLIANFTIGPTERGVAPPPRSPRTPDRVGQENPPPPEPPGPLPAAQKGLKAAPDGGGVEPGPGAFEAPDKPVLNHLELDARNSWKYERGHLDLTLPYDVDPDGEYILFNKNFPHALSVTVKVEEGETYLVDFEVSSWGSGTYTVKTDGGEQEFPDQNAKAEHILVGLNASESGWTTIRLTRSGTGWYMYSATIDRVD